MKKIFPLLAIVLIFSLLTVSALEFSYTGDTYNTPNETNSVEVFDDYIYFITQGLSFRQAPLELNASSTLITTVATDQVLGRSDVDTNYSEVVLLKFADTRIRYKRTPPNFATTSGLTNVSDELPVSANMTSIWGGHIYNGNKLRILGNDGWLYFLTVTEQSVSDSKWLDLFYNSRSYIGDEWSAHDDVAVYSDDTYVYLTDRSDDLVYLFDLTGSLVDTATVPNLDNITSLFILDGEYYIASDIYPTFDWYSYSLGASSEETFTVGGNTYSRTLCIDSDYICTNTTYYVDLDGSVVFTCPSVNETQYCSNGCVNADNGGIITGTCSQLGCVNTCNIEGKSSCTTANTYSICGDFDGDACLELGVVTNCPANQFCSEDPQQGAGCSAPTQSQTYWTQDFLSVTADVGSHTGVLVEEGVALPVQEVPRIEKVLNIVVGPWTVDAVKWLMKTFSFTTATTSITVNYDTTAYFDANNLEADYFAKDCDYEEELVFGDDLTHNNLGGNGWVGSGTINNSAEYNYVYTNNSLTKTITPTRNNFIQTIIEPETTGNYTVEYVFNNGTEIKYNIYHNKTSYQTIIYEEQNNKIIVNTTSTSDDLEEIYLGTRFINDVNTATLHVNLVRLVLGQYIDENYYSLPLATNTAGNVEKINYSVIDSNDRLKIYQVNGNKVVNGYPQYTDYNNLTKSVSCTYSESKVYTTRFYGNEQGMPTYHFYDDTLVPSTVNDEVLADAPTIISDDRSALEKIFGKTWGKTTKLLVAILVVMSVLITFIILARLEDMVILSVIGTVLSGMLLVYFTVIGYVDAWVLVLFGIIGALLITAMVRNAILGNGG